MKFLILFLLTGIYCIAQVPDIAKDTLNLEEVIVTNNGRKQKTREVKIEGVCSSPEDMKDAAELITLVEELPKGKLGSVAFYFNKIDPETLKKNSGRFKEAEFEVVLYDVDREGMPGIPSAVEMEYMVVDKAHRGKVTVNLSYLKIDTNGKMFIGLRKLSKDPENRSFLVDCLCNGQDKYTTYTRKDASSPWQRRWVCAAIKMDVDVIVPQK